jgi:7-cyano-7-deazaguanine reductase
MQNTPESNTISVISFFITESLYRFFLKGQIMNDKKTFVLPFNEPEMIRTDLLETFEYEGEKQRITYVTKEFAAVCPFSGLPDLATVEIVYVPSNKCIELKSLKLYFVSFRNVGIYQEHLTNRIYNDIFKLIRPAYFKLTTRYATRGGIDAVCEICSDSEIHDSNGAVS